MLCQIVFLTLFFSAHTTVYLFLHRAFVFLSLSLSACLGCVCMSASSSQKIEDICLMKLGRPDEIRTPLLNKLKTWTALETFILQSRDVQWGSRVSAAIYIFVISILFIISGQTAVLEHQTMYVVIRIKSTGQHFGKIESKYPNYEWRVLAILSANIDILTWPPVAKYDLAEPGGQRNVSYVRIEEL